MKTAFKMNISLKIFLGYFLLVGLAAWFILNIFVEEVKPGVRQAMEDALVDTANVLAELAANDMKTNRILSGQFAQSLYQYQQRINQSNIWDIKQKQHAEYRVYVTNVKGVVVYDSTSLALGEDYSQWNDVYLTLQGKYGARSSPVIPGDENSDTIMYVAAPIKDGDQIIGSLTVAKPNSTMTPFIKRAQTKIIRWGLVLIALSLTLGALFTWRFTAKINKLRDYAIRVTQGEKAIAPTSSNDELSELAMAMQTMRSELDGKQYFQDSVEHLTHELKSPITAIQGAVELISPDMPADKQKHFIGQIKTQTKRVQTIIQNMLGLAALEHQQQLEHATDIHLNHLIELQIEHLEDKATQKNVQFDFINRPDIYIEGDSFLLGQAIYNLLDNAVEFSPIGGIVSIQIHQDNLQAQINIEDNGPGIPDYALDRIFNKFYSLPRPDTQQKSTGLGLNFVKEVTALHNGEISLSNRTETGVNAQLVLPKY